MNKFILLVLLLVALQASEIVAPVSLAVTVYNDQFAIVKDTRSASLDGGRSDLYFTDVSANIETETVTFKALTNPESVKVFEQNFEANLINTQAILKKYIDKEIEIYAQLGTSSVKVNGTLLGYNSGYILKTSKGIEVYNDVEGINFPSLPDGFLTLPTLHWKVFSDQAATTDVEVAYRTTGFSWKSDYSVTLNEDESKADVGGWVTIDNNSGKRYQQAKLKLIAGDVNTVNNNKNFARPEMMMMDGASARSAPSFSEKSFSDFHMYTLSQPVDLQENSQKQVEFLGKVYGINVRKYNFISTGAGGYSENNLKASNKIEISNTESNQLGVPLPKGTVRVFKTDSADNSLEFIGQDSIDHTPKDENITLTTGNAFDITADKVAANRRNYDNGGYTADLNLTISNHKDISAEIVVEINNYYGDNNEFTWKTQGINVQQVNANLYRISRVFAAGEKYSYLWTENYRR